MTPIMIAIIRTTGLVEKATGRGNGSAERVEALVAGVSTEEGYLRRKGNASLGLHDFRL